MSANRSLSGINHNPASVARYRYAWTLRQKGWLYREIAAEIGISKERARQIIFRADRRIRRATEVYDAAVHEPMAYEVWHVFDHDGRVTNGAKLVEGNPMKHGHPSREWSDGKKQAHEVKRDHAGELRRGTEHLKEHHAEERREIERTGKEKR